MNAKHLREDYRDELMQISSDLYKIELALIDAKTAGISAQSAEVRSGFKAIVLA